jgi:spore coat polysaccharide biosynthesis protein SpsF (cytidylyltransferase family)
MIIGIIQARLASTRLPGKVLMEVVPGISMLEMVIRKVAIALQVDTMTVTTPDSQLMDHLPFSYVDWHVYKGEYRNVLTEFWFAAQQNVHDYPEDTIGAIVRITADCPLIRPEIIDKCVQEFLDREVDLVYNSFEDTGADGSDVEVFSMSALETANKNAVHEREHPTVWMRENLRTHYVGTPFTGCSVDTMEDLLRVRQMFAERSCWDF